MTEQHFWEIIETAWRASPELYELRSKALRTNNEEDLEELSVELGDAILENYRQNLLLLDQETLTNYILILEEKLYKIDREEIHEYTDGSDDGFLYCRCFILGMGEEYYKMVDKNPAKAAMDLEAEDFGFLVYTIYKEKFGEEFARNSVYCIESGSNKADWKTL
jgi:Protein of unknown function (DUF4240)